MKTAVLLALLSLSLPAWAQDEEFLADVPPTPTSIEEPTPTPTPPPPGDLPGEPGLPYVPGEKALEE